MSTYSKRLFEQFDRQFDRRTSDGEREGGEGLQGLEREADAKAEDERAGIEGTDDASGPNEDFNLLIRHAPQPSTFNPSAPTLDFPLLVYFACPGDPADRKVVAQLLNPVGNMFVMRVKRGDPTVHHLIYLELEQKAFESPTQCAGFICSNPHNTEGPGVFRVPSLGGINLRACKAYNDVRTRYFMWSGNSSHAPVFLNEFWPHESSGIKKSKVKRRRTIVHRRVADQSSSSSSSCLLTTDRGGSGEGENGKVAFQKWKGPYPMSASSSRLATQLGAQPFLKKGVSLPCGHERSDGPCTHTLVKHLKPFFHYQCQTCGELLTGAVYDCTNCGRTVPETHSNVFEGRFCGLFQWCGVCDLPPIGFELERGEGGALSNVCVSFEFQHAKSRSLLNRSFPVTLPVNRGDKIEEIKEWGEMATKRTLLQALEDECGEKVLSSPSEEEGEDDDVLDDNDLVEDLDDPPRPPQHFKNPNTVEDDDDGGWL